jgi:CheY-like chemotaxis protein
MQNASKKAATILVVEDDESISSLLEQILRLEDHTVQRATNGRNALDILKKNEILPDLILLDLTMPIMDGAEFRRVQLQDSRIAVVPVILMTADSQVNTLAADLQIKHVLKKPLSIETLLNSVTHILVDK